MDGWMDGCLSACVSTLGCVCARVCVCARMRACAHVYACVCLMGGYERAWVPFARAWVPLRVRVAVSYTHLRAHET